MGERFIDIPQREWLLRDFQPMGEWLLERGCETVRLWQERSDARDGQLYMWEIRRLFHILDDLRGASFAMRVCIPDRDEDEVYFRMKFA